MAIPLLLLVSATFASAIVAYGAHPGWARWGWGLKVIVLSRYLQWPLVALALVLCLVMIGLVVAGRRRAWWLIGLGPVLALFVHRFQTDPLRGYGIVEEPTFISASEAGDFLEPDDFVVGLTFNGTAYAYPYVALYRAPIVFQSDREQRLVLLWSAFANRATAHLVGRDVRGRDFEIVSMPADSLLAYNRRLGEFIVGVTGRTTDGRQPREFKDAVRTTKARWADWAAEHPQTKVMTLAGHDLKGQLPDGPLWPLFPKPVPSVIDGVDEKAWVVMIGRQKPVAVRMEDVPAAPTAIMVDDVPVVAWHDERSGRVRAYERRVGERTLTFTARSGGILVDAETGSGWNAEGVAVEGVMAKEGRRLREVWVDEYLYWGVVKTWYPATQLVWKK